MLGGVLWCTGNVMVVPIVRTIGLALGLVIWGSANLLMGYFSGRFGLFGLEAQEPANPALSSAGIAVAVVSIVIASLVESNTAGGAAEDDEADKAKVEAAKAGDEREQSLLGSGYGGGAINDSIGGATSIDQAQYDLYSGQSIETGTAGSLQSGTVEKAGAAGEKEEKEGQDESFVTDALPKNVQRILGVVMSLASGMLYGSCFDPPQYNANKAKQIANGGSGDGHRAKMHRWADDSATLSDYILS